jgi:hypothetical protein
MPAYITQPKGHPWKRQNLNIQIFQSVMIKSLCYLILFFVLILSACCYFQNKSLNKHISLH